VVLENACLSGQYMHCHAVYKWGFGANGLGFSVAGKSEEEKKIRPL
jgi:hypothetical protein